MPKFEKKDGWRTKGSKQLTDRLEKQGIENSIVMHVSTDSELDKARESWAGFIRLNDSVHYRGVEIRKV